MAEGSHPAFPRPDPYGPIPGGSVICRSTLQSGPRFPRRRPDYRPRCTGAPIQGLADRRRSSEASSFAPQAIDDSLHFSGLRELACLSLTQALSNVLDLPVMRLQVRVQGFLDNVTAVAVERCGDRVQAFPGLRIDPHRKRLLEHVIHRSTA